MFNLALNLNETDGDACGHVVTELAAPRVKKSRKDKRQLGVAHWLELGNDTQSSN